MARLSTCHSTASRKDGSSLTAWCDSKKIYSTEGCLWSTASQFDRFGLYIASNVWRNKYPTVDFSLKQQFYTDIKIMCDSGQLLHFNYGTFTKRLLTVYFYVFPAVAGAVSPQPTICFSSFISAAQAIWNNSVYPIQNKTNSVCALSSFCIISFVSHTV